MNPRIVSFFVSAVSLSILTMTGCSTPSSQSKSQPQLISRVNPQYPFEMRRDGITGEVLVDFVVDMEGRPTQIAAVKSSRKEFEPAAVAAVAKWRFKPGMVDGKPVNTHLTVPIYFTLGQK